ncbi:MAG: MBL fold metallo-hydrolase [Clostridia bacterium]|nr:MBL fold metallo-hydrolase [Clostridia bacterium]
MKVDIVDLNIPDLANCWLLTDEATGKAALVDIGWYTDELDEFIRRNKIDVEYILLTHGHFDHIMGAAKAKEATGARVLIHKDDNICLTDKKYNLMDDFGVTAPLYPCEADIIADDGIAVNIGESEITVMHTPGHSAGSVIFIDKKGRNIISGDTLFYSTVGRTDKIGSSTEALADSLRKIIALDGDYTIYPGHGPVTSLSHERVRNIFIRRMDR